MFRNQPTLAFFLLISAQFLRPCHSIKNEPSRVRGVEKILKLQKENVQTLKIAKIEGFGHVVPLFCNFDPFSQQKSSLLIVHHRVHHENVTQWTR